MRVRLLFVFVGVVAVVLLAHDLPLAAHLEEVERDRLVTKLERDAFILGGRIEEALEAGNATENSAVDALVARYSVSEGVRVVVTDAAGIGVATSEGGASVGEDFSNRTEFATALTGMPTTGERASATLGEDLFYVAVPVLSGDDVVGTVRISAPARVVSDRTDQRVRNLFIVAAISLLIAMLIALLFAVYVTRPLQRLRAATIGLAKGDLSRRADVESGPPEVRDLATSFNTMADRLEGLIERQREFASTASHQLRTPLTALRLRLDQIASQVGNDAVGEQTADAITETERLHRMIEGLLTLSRAEARTEVVSIDVSRIVEERVEAWSALADERMVHLTLEPLPLASLHAAAIDGALEQILDNLVDNALDVAPEGSTVTVSVLTRSDAVEIHVVDEGPGLTAAERARAFERFWRAPSAAEGGSGLGLSIVRELARAGGGDAVLLEAESGGVDAVVTLATSFHGLSGATSTGRRPAGAGSTSEEHLPQ